MSKERKIINVPKSGRLSPKVARAAAAASVKQIPKSSLETERNEYLGTFGDSQKNSSVSRVVINLYGGPGAGKSTIAAHIFALLKHRGINSELITEYVKNWVWEGREIKRNDQYYLFAKQARFESLKFKEVDVIVTDAPVWLSAIYEAKYEPKPHICQLLIDKHVALAKEYGIEHKHVFLHRTKPYQTLGRLQTEQEAKEIDNEILDYFKEQGIEISHYNANEIAASSIIQDILS